MDRKEAEKYLLAGKITKKVVEKAKKSIKPGEKLLEIALNIEKSILDIAKEEGAKKGAFPAFPVNLSINENAAHFTPDSACELVLEESHLLKVDLGTQIEGYICDTAFSLNFDNSQAKLIEAAELALENALAMAKEGTGIGKIGTEIEKTIKAKGFNPIKNLTGHGLAKFEQHASPSIPNIATTNPKKLEEGAFAIEPFATNGEGYVKEGQQSEIFALDKIVPIRNAYARQVLEVVSEKFETLPFALRWVEKELKMPEFQRKVAIRELLKTGCIKAFPVLHEETGKMVSQAEKSFIIFEGKTTVLC